MAEAQDTPTKKTSARKPPAKKAPAKDPEAGPRPASKPKPVQVARKAAEQLTELTGKQPESVTGIESTDDGWRIQLEVVESHRIPDSADMLAIYEVEADKSGDLTGYRRVRRYARGRAGEDQEGRL